MSQIRSIAGILASAAMLCGCNETLDFRNAEVSQGKVYAANANTGFSGKLTNVPFDQLPANKIYTVAVRAAQAKEVSAVNYAAALSGALCNTRISEGIVDGETTCWTKDNSMPLLKFDFKQGQLEGDIIVYDLVEKDSVFVSGEFTNGQFKES